MGLYAIRDNGTLELARGVVDVHFYTDATRQFRKHGRIEDVLVFKLIEAIASRRCVKEKNGNANGKQYKTRNQMCQTTGKRVTLISLALRVNLASLRIIFFMQIEPNEHAVFN